MKKTIATLLAIALLLPACAFNRVNVTNRSTSIAAGMEDSAVLLRMKVQKTIHNEDTDEDKIRTGWGSCSGVYIKNNIILTAAHCVVMPEDITLKEVWVRKSGVSERAIPVKVDPQADLALLYTPLSGVPVRLASRVVRGEDIWVIGNPLGLRDIITKGIVSNSHVSASDEKASFVIIDATVLPGNSGGAVVDTNGELVGILTRSTSLLGFLGASGLGLAVDLTTIKTFLQSK